MYHLFSCKIVFGFQKIILFKSSFFEVIADFETDSHPGNSLIRSFCLSEIIIFFALILIIHVHNTEVIKAVLGQAAFLIIFCIPFFCKIYIFQAVRYVAAVYRTPCDLPRPYELLRSRQILLQISAALRKFRFCLLFSFIRIQCYRRISSKTQKIKEKGSKFLLNFFPRSIIF